MRRAVLLLVLAALGSGSALAAAQESGWPGGPPEAAAALRFGNYENAEKFYREALREPGARLGLAETLRQTGRYREALETLDDAGATNDPRLLLEQARIRLEIGEGHRARELFREVIERSPRPTDAMRLEAEALLGELELQLGERSAGLALFDGIIETYNNASDAAFTARGLVAVGRAAARLGFQSSGLFRDALRVFDEAAALDPADPLPRLLAGELLLGKYNSAEAAESFQAVLAQNPQHPRALLGVAQLRETRRSAPGGPEELDPLARALAVNPYLPAARALEVQRLLERDQTEEAAARATEAFETLPDAPEVQAALAAVHFLADEDDGLAEIETRFRTNRPGDPRLDLGLARAAERRRRYREAARRAEAALAVEPESAAAGRLLGLNLLRLGAMDEGRAALEAAFARDPFDALVKNNLDLLDELDSFEVISSPPFEFVLPPAEAALLAPYVEAVSREAIEVFRERYGYDPDETIRIEIYDRSADFSVRTVGIPGIGAHGVCFGSVIAMESPSARQIGAYHWASTLWHELGHVIAMDMTDNRVPRWYTEGLSLLEERERYGEGAQLGFFVALRDERLLDVSHLNDGFVRPTYPGQVAVSYFHASLVLEHIEAEYGFDAVLGMLDGYKRGQTSAEVIEGTLGISDAELDEAVDALIEARFGVAAEGMVRPVAGAGVAPVRVGPPAPGAPEPRDELTALVELADAAPEDFTRQLRAGIALFEDGQHEAATTRLEKAAELAPDYAGADGPNRFLADIHERAGREDEARVALSRHVTRVPAAYDAWLRLAEMRSLTGDLAGAADALSAAIAAYPMLAEPHARLAEVAGEQGANEIAVRERLAVLATDPPDRAEALHALALAHHHAGDAQAARRRVLQALEIAPTFDAALRLLLELRRTS